MFPAPWAGVRRNGVLRAPLRGAAGYGLVTQLPCGVVVVRLPGVREEAARIALES